MQSQILPVMTEASSTLAMVKYCIMVILQAHLFSNLGETPWVTVDHPLFTLLKIMQWFFSETHVLSYCCSSWKKLQGQA